MKYLEELNKAMQLLAENGYYFIGQSVKFQGNAIYHTIKNLPIDKRIELPVQEEMQMGISAGMTLEGLKVCSIFPRFDFILRGMDSLVNHLDKVKYMSDGQFLLKGLIIRTAIGSNNPIMPGCQHTQDYTEALKLMCKHIKVVKLEKAEDILSAYQEAMNSDVPTFIIEIPELYNQDLKQDFIEARKKLIA